MTCVNVNVHRTFCARGPVEGMSIYMMNYISVGWRYALGGGQVHTQTPLVCNDNDLKLPGR